MSGVYIKGMEMPHNCVGCKLWYLIPLADTMEDICRVTGHRVNPYHRADDCPLIPVPDHGDLIDKSGVDVLSWTEDPEKDFADGVLFVLDKLDELPVIIPEDGEDYEATAEEGEG